MSKRLTLRTVAAVSVLALLICASLYADRALAATPKRPGGITVSPAFQDVTLNNQKTSETFQFKVTNNTSEPHEFSISVVDFGSLDESGGVMFIGESNKEIDYRYGLTSWADIERDRIVVEPKKTETVPITINNQESLAPGGHYGAVLLTPVGSGERPTKVKINQVLSSLLFVKKEGGEVYNFGLRSFEVSPSLFKQPSEVDMRFQNAGNVHTIPRGTVTVTDPRGRVVQRGIINVNSGIVLPESFRQLKVGLEPMAASWMPGKYKMSIAYRFDGQEATELKELEYTYVSAWYIIAAALISVFSGLLIGNRRFRRFVFNRLRIMAKNTKKFARR